MLKVTIVNEKEEVQYSQILPEEVSLSRVITELNRKVRVRKSRAKGATEQEK